jgi:SAM-dependent methyltransferase
MREVIREFVQICAETLPIAEPVVEFGALQVPGQEGFADLRPIFPSRRYLGTDFRAGPGVDVVLDLRSVALRSDSVGTVLSLDTIEHVEYVREGVAEMHRVIAPGGVLVLASVMDFPIHDFPHDYWRFTPEAFRSLLKPFRACFVASAGRADFPHTVVGLGFKGPEPAAALAALGPRVEAWREAWRLSDKIEDRDRRPRSRLDRLLGRKKRKRRR